MCFVVNHAKVECDRHDIYSILILSAWIYCNSFVNKIDKIHRVV